MTEEIRKRKSIHSEEGRKKYKSLDNVRRITEAREKWCDEQCAEYKHVRQGKNDGSFIQEDFKVN